MNQEITLRDYFIAHAPPVPDWFIDEVERPQHITGSEISSWSSNVIKERTFEWPIYWADKMMDRRKQKKDGIE